MAAEINPNDRVTPWVLKWIFLPLIVGGFLLMCLEVQFNQWKCSREAKGKDTLKGISSPATGSIPRHAYAKGKPDQMERLMRRREKSLI